MTRIYIRLLQSLKNIRLFLSYISQISYLRYNYTTFVQYQIRKYCILIGYNSMEIKLSSHKIYLLRHILGGWQYDMIRSKKCYILVSRLELAYTQFDADR